MSAKLENIFAIIARWMDGSLFFRGLVVVMDFVRNICARSFTARAFIADPTPLEESAKRSIFIRVVDKLLNGLPKPVTMPTYWHPTLSRLCSGSWFISTFFEWAGIPIPPPAEKSQVGFGIRAFVQWALFAVPAIGVIAVVFAVPFLPTMMLAFLLLPILFFILISRKFVLDITAIFIIIFILVSALAAVFSVTPGSSIQIAILTSVFMLATLAVVACSTTKKTVELLMLVFVASSAFTGLYGLYQVLTGYVGNVWLDPELFAGERLRVFSTFGNPNVYGTYLLLAIPLSAACFVYFKNPFIKLCSLGAAGLLVINLFLTLSRGCYLSLALAVGVFVLIINKRLVVLFIPAVLALPFILPANIWNRVLSIFNMQDTSTAFRLNIWRGSIRMLQDFWLTGVGQGIEAYNTVYPFYSLAAIHAPHSHSLYIQYLVEIGIVGFIVFILLMGGFFRTMATFLRRTTDFKNRIMAAAMVAAVIGFLFQGVTDFVFYNYRVLLSFYLFLGISIAFARVNTPPPPSKPAEPMLVGNYHD